MAKLCMCNKIYKCHFHWCSHRKPHEKGRACELFCERINDKANCEFICQGFNPEEIISEVFGSTNG